MRKRRTSAPMIWLREKRIVDSQEEFGQLFIAWPHQRSPICFKNRNQSLLRQPVHNTQCSENSRDIPLNVIDTVLVQPTPGVSAQRTVWDNVQRHERLVRRGSRQLVDPGQFNSRVVSLQNLIVGKTLACETVSAHL